MFEQLIKRSVVGGSIAALVVLLLAFANAAFVPFVNIGLVALLACSAIFEYHRFLGESASRVDLAFQLIFGAVTLLATLLTEWHVLPYALLTLAVMGAFVVQLRATDGAVGDCARRIFPLIYIVAPLVMLMQLLYATPGVNGPLIVGFLLAVVKGSDIGAYFFGKTLGRTPLASSISPGKTWEGTVCGIALAIVIGFCFSFGFERISWYWGLILGGVLAVVGAVGDLAESLLKRDVGVKDSSSLPGLGGVLDMLDSLLFAIPILYFYIYLI